MKEYDIVKVIWDTEVDGYDIKAGTTGTIINTYCPGVFAVELMDKKEPIVVTLYDHQVTLEQSYNG